MLNANLLLKLNNLQKIMKKKPNHLILKHILDKFNIKGSKYDRVEIYFFLGNLTKFFYVYNFSIFFFGKYKNFI